MASSAQMSYEVLGAVKIKDGVFVGDELAAQDLEFVVANKVTHVINCCGRQVPNHWEPIGVVYLTYFWVDNDTQIILDPKDVVANEIFDFIDECLSHAESVLIHSVRGQSRSCCVLAAYMMRKYSWSLRKTMEFLVARRPDIGLKAGFLQQLSAYERRLQNAKQRLTSEWSDLPVGSQTNPLECEEFLLRNTYLNSQMGGHGEPAPRSDVKEQGTARLVWADGGTEDKSRLEKSHDGGAKQLITKRTSALGQTEIKPILKKRKIKPDHHTLQSRPTTASSENEPPLSASAKPCWNERDASSTDMVMSDNREKPISAWEQDCNDHNVPLRSSFLRDSRDVRDSRDIRSANARDLRDVRDVPRESRALDARESHESRVSHDTRELRDIRDVREAREIREVRDSREFSQVRDERPSSTSHRMRSPSCGSKNDFGSNLSGLRGKDELTPSGRFLPGSKSGGPSKSDRYDSGLGATRPRRDASPKNDRDRLGLRSDSPLRLLTKNPQTTTMKSQNLCLGSLPSRSSNVLAGPSVISLRSSGVNGGVMGAYRGGPVKAKMDLVSADCMRKQRPATAPSTRQSYNRPASPLGICRQSSNSRPASPNSMQTRPSQPPRSFSSPSYGTSIDKQQPRSLSSHMRRAPSPTPAFNRAASPGKPRWRM